MFELDFAKLLTALKKNKQSIGEYTLYHELSMGGATREEITAQMKESFEVMKSAAENARVKPLHSVSGLTSGNAYCYEQYKAAGKSICGNVIADAMAMALSCSEVNASMQRIVACPTAGSCGIVPAAVIAVGKEYHKTEDDMIMALFTAAGVGLIIGDKACLSGAEGGCQAECGSAAAMGAAAVTELMGGTPEMAFHAAALSIKNCMGLVCDPVAGLVEIPCIKRNAAGAVSAVTTADLALAGVKSYIPFDEVVDAMASVGKNMDVSLRETALGGLAMTPTGIKLKNQLESKAKIEE